MKNFMKAVEFILEVIIISMVLIAIAVGSFQIYQKANHIIELNKQPSYELLSNMTVRLEHRYVDYFGDNVAWVGTGSIVKITDDYTYILTNKHVAPIGKDMTVIDGKKEYPGTVIKNCEYFDLSLVQVFGKIPNKVAVEKIDSVYPQDIVYSVGMYRGLNYIYTEGSVAGEYIDDEGNESVVANMPCAGGCSGSGVFDKDGDLVAVIYAGFLDGYFAMDNAKSICVPSYAIEIFLEEIL